MLEEYLNVDTPENVKFDYEIAGIGSRFIALLIDTLIILLILGLLAILIGIVVLSADFRETNESILIALAVAFGFAVLWGYYIFFEIAWNGQTPGKRQIGIRTIRVDGLPAGKLEIVIRNLMRLVDILPSGYGVGIITMFISPKSRRVGDYAAGTIVVYDETPIQLDEISAPSWQQSQIEISEPVRSLPVHMLSQKTIMLAESFLARKDGLKGSAALATQLLAQMYAEMKLEDAVAYLEKGMHTSRLQEICALIREN